MSRPTIFYLLHYLENRGGTENHVRDLMQGLKSQFRIFALYREGDNLVVRDEDNQISRYATESIPWLFVPYSAPRTEAVLQKLINQFKPSLVHIHHLINWPLSTVELLKRNSIKTVLTLHDYFLITPDFTLQSASDPKECLSAPYAQRLGLANADYLNKRHIVISKFLPLIDKVVCPSHACQNIFAQIFKLQYRVIEHGIAAFEALAHSPNPRTKLGFIGSLLPQKGWQILLQAFEQLANPNYELHFYGGQEELSKKNVYFHGIYERPDLPKICSEIELAVIPSVFAETYCYTLSELWMGKVPVVASRIGALKDRIQDQANGMTFQPGNVAQLAQVLNQVLASKQHLQWKIPRPRELPKMLQEYTNLYLND